MSELGKQAEEYARVGWYVFPLKPRDKTPLTAHGLNDATTKVETVRSWWGKVPQANIGLNCGKSGLVAIDLDQRGAYDGLAEWEAIAQKHGLHLQTAVSLTGGGGRHLLFRVPPGCQIKNSAGKLAPGIDVRGAGGYIVLPPSLHPTGNLYRWEAEQALAPLPQIVIELLTREPDPWQVFTLKDAFSPREPLTWIVEGLVSEGSLSIWYGAPGTLKSMLLSDMAVSVAAGYRWLTQPDNPLSGRLTFPAPVMWLDFDNGQRRTHERFAALAHARGLADSAPLYYVSMPDPIFSAGETESVRTLAARLIDRDCRLLIIDNLSVIAGEADENSADMNGPMSGLRWLSETGLAVIVIHHQRKSNGLATRPGETLRGHGSIEAKLDLSLLVTRQEETVTITPTKSRGPSVKPFSAKFTFENDAAHELKTARFWPVETTAEEESEQDDETMRALILEEIKKFGPLSANQIYERVGGNRSKTLDLIRRMKIEKRLGEQKNNRGGFLLYQLD